MLESTIALIILSLTLGLAAWLAFVWAVKRGEFDDPEGPKYRMLGDDGEDQLPVVSSTSSTSMDEPGPEKTGPKGGVPAIFSYNKVILALAAIMLFSMALIDSTIIVQQRKSLISTLEQRAEEDLELASTFMIESLLRNRFTDIDLFIQQWSRANSEVVRFTAITPLGHTLTDFQRPEGGGHSFIREKKIEFNQRHLLTLRLEKDYSRVEMIVGQLRVRLILASLFITSALSLTLWFIFRRMAINPLEREVERRRRAEGELSLANQHLEERVAERTGEIGELLDREKYLREIMQTVTDINGLLVTAPDQATLLANSCARFVRHGHYEFCWIGLLDGAKPKGEKSREARLSMLYNSMPDGEAMAPPPYDYHDPEASFYTHPAARTLRRNQTVTCAQNDYPLGSPPWRNHRVVAGFKWVISLPLRSGGKGELLGVLTVYSWRPEGFEPEEITMLEELAGDLGFAVDSFRHRAEVARLTAERTANYEETIFTFVDMIEQRDTYTAGHTERVAHYCRKIAKEMGLAEGETNRLYRAASLHDIGKIATPDAVLLKPGRLDSLEHDLIKLHAVAGYEMLSNIAMYQDLAQIILHHHERHDGKGYPDGLAGDEVPLLARILSVADAFDAMTTNRIYKPRMVVETALDELRACSGGQFHPRVVEAAVKALAGVEPSALSGAAGRGGNNFCKTHPALCGVDQKPVTDLEQKRFSYFFNDRLTGLYNEGYLKFFIRSNQEDYAYTCLHVLHLQGIAGHNKRLGWEQGDMMLKYFAEELKIHFPQAKLFRAYGNDFVVVFREHRELKEKELGSFACLVGTDLKLVSHHLDLVREHKYTIDKLEKIELQEIVDR